MQNIFLEGNKIYLRAIQEQDANDEYLSWINDYEVVKYTESRFFPHNLEALRQYIRNMNNDNNITFAIIEISENKHIGNIKLGNISWIHRYADIGLIIGNKNFWGKGVALEAIELVVDYAFNRINLRKVTAGIYMDNIGSVKAFKKANFKQSYIEKNKYFFEGNYTDSLTLELTKN